jgi:Mor family transcriptional regulator
MEEDRVLARLTGDFRAFAVLVGVEAALKTAKAFGGLALAVPKLDSIYREERDKEIRDAYDRGEPVRRLARRYNLTARRVYNILKRETYPGEGV